MTERFYVNVEQCAVIEVHAEDWKEAKNLAREWAQDTPWSVGDVLDADEEDRSGFGDPEEPIAVLPEEDDDTVELIEFEVELPQGGTLLFRQSFTFVPDKEE